jgi:hypothetical protein
MNIERRGPRFFRGLLCTHLLPDDIRKKIVNKIIGKLTKISERDKIRREARKLRMKSLSKPRKILYWVTLTVAPLAFVAGFMMAKVITGLAIMYVLWVLVLPIITRSPKLKRVLLVGMMLNPHSILAAGIAVFGLTNADIYKVAAADQALIKDSLSELAVDAKKFHEDFQSGDVQIVGVLSNYNTTLKHARNDNIGYELMKLTFAPMHWLAPKDVETKALLPFAEMYYVDRVIVLSNRNLMEKLKERSNARLEAEYGKPISEISMDEHRASTRGYGAIIMLTCTVKDDGEVLLASGMPHGWTVDFHSIPEAAPFIEVCESVALMDPEDLSKLEEA